MISSLTSSNNCLIRCYNSLVLSINNVIKIEKLFVFVDLKDVLVGLFKGKQGNCMVNSLLFLATCRHWTKMSILSTYLPNTVYWTYRPLPCKVDKFICRVGGKSYPKASLTFSFSGKETVAVKNPTYRRA